MKSGVMQRVTVVRAIVEAAGPIHIGAGRGDETSDADVVRDMNGLPTIPGTSLAGVLRAGLEEEAGARGAQALFGYQERGHGAASRLSVSFGLLLDSRGQPVEGLCSPQRLRDDPVLAAARRALLRHHVRIGPSGAAGDRGKFDERLVPRGCRFVFELTLAHYSASGSREEAVAAEAAADEAFERVVERIGAELRVGGRTRRGLGRLRGVELRRRDFDLRRREDLDAYLRLPVSIAAPASDELLPVWEPPGALVEGVVARVELEALSPWGAGGVEPEGDEDIALHREEQVVWTATEARVEVRHVLPATAFKGALAHRVAFYDNLARGRFLGAKDDQAPRFGEENESVAELFGRCLDDGEEREHDEPDPPRGVPGRVYVEDVVLGDASPSDVVHHNGIDRFTGGTLPGTLFSERVLRPGTLPSFELRVERPGDLSPEARRALHRALSDLERGRLQLGHGHGRGNGWMRGTLRWSEPGEQWLREAGGGEA